jgi:hypothetical protein
MADESNSFVRSLEAEVGGGVWTESLSCKLHHIVRAQRIWVSGHFVLVIRSEEEINRNMIDVQIYLSEDQA